LVDLVFPHVGDFGVEFCDRTFGLEPILRELCFARKPLLQQCEATLVPFERVRAVEDGTVGQRRPPLDAEVDADDLAHHWVNGRFDIAFGRERDEPLTAVEADRHAFDFTCDLTLHRASRTAEAEPADLGQIDALVLKPKALREADPLCIVFALEGRRLRRQLRIERALIGFNQIVERLLQRLRVNVAQKWEPSFEFEQPIAERFAPDGQRIAGIVPELVLGQNRVPHQARTTDELAQDVVLRAVGVSRNT
jgi:hypothetical protein